MAEIPADASQFCHPSTVAEELANGGFTRFTMPVGENPPEPGVLVGNR